MNGWVELKIIKNYVKQIRKNVFQDMSYQKIF